MREEKSQFHYRILPIDPDFPDNSRRPTAAIQQEALTDILCQLVTYLTAAAKTRVAHKRSCGTSARRFPKPRAAAARTIKPATAAAR